MYRWLFFGTRYPDSYEELEGGRRVARSLILLVVVALDEEEEEEPDEADGIADELVDGLLHPRNETVAALSRLEHTKRMNML